MSMELLPQEQPPTEDKKLKEFLARLVILINGVLENIFDSESDSLIDLYAGDDTIQAPSTTDTELQILFGAAQGGNLERIDLGADGTVTINISGSYRLDALFHVTSGTVNSMLLIYAKVNDVINGEVLFTQIEAVDHTFPISMIRELQLVRGDTLKFYIVRDSAGADDGELIPFSPSTAIPDVYSARLQLIRQKLLK
jgi:hypothetical protein